MGGLSAEREVSLMSGRRVMGALDPARYDAYAVDLADISRSRGADLARLLSSPDSGDLPDAVFIALHGGVGENGTVQGLLEMLGLPYTGSGVLASALAMNKIYSKQLFAQAGLPTPKWVALHARDLNATPDGIATTLDQPWVVKPACQGSTIGVTIVQSEAELPAALDLAFAYGDQAVVEQFISGTEITGPVLGTDHPQVLPLIEIVPSGGFYDYTAKYTPGATEEIIPARISEAQTARGRALALAAHHALGCRALSRVDLIAAEDDVYVLEVNTIPGLTDTSLVPRSAEAAGISFPELVDRLIQSAMEDSGQGGA
jgi:D-alanine-D-alanine ligase